MNVQNLLSDYNCIGQAQRILSAYHRLGVNDIVPVQLTLFNDVGIEPDANDEIVWRYCQENKMLLITGNRRTVDGAGSLEMTIRRLYRTDILPVLTIGSLNRVNYDRAYCEACAISMAEILVDLTDYIGVGRLYLP